MSEPPLVISHPHEANNTSPQVSSIGSYRAHYARYVHESLGLPTWRADDVIHVAGRSREQSLPIIGLINCPPGFLLRRKHLKRGYQNKFGSPRLAVPRQENSPQAKNSFLTFFLSSSSSFLKGQSFFPSLFFFFLRYALKLAHWSLAGKMMPTCQIF